MITLEVGADGRRRVEPSDIDRHRAVLTERYTAHATSAWATGDSAGDRRGRLGIVGTSYETSTNSAAWRALRWGRLPTPTVAPVVSQAARWGVPSTAASGRTIPVIVTPGTPARRLRTGGKLSPVPGRLTTQRIERLVPWLLRAVWIVVVLLAIPAIDAACEGRPDTVHDVARIVGGALWVLASGGDGDPRRREPDGDTARGSARRSGFGDDGGRRRWRRRRSCGGFVAAALAATFLAAGAPLGRGFVQASAYGDEDRHLLRPPLGLLAAAVITWAVWAGAVLAGPLLLADRRWIIGTMAVRWRSAVARGDGVAGIGCRVGGSCSCPPASSSTTSSYSARR